ncbi:MAG: aldo/keto reductase [Acidobacteriota bacterium]
MSISRRNFLTSVSAGVAGMSLDRTGRSESAGPEGQGAAPKVQKYKPFGKTGLKISDVSFGVISLFDANVLRYAYDRGVNYFDTAEGYLNKQSETMIGQALKSVRDKVVITTKYVFRNAAERNRAEIVKRAEASLKRLQTDHVDVAMVHSVDEPSVLDDPEIQAGYRQLRKEGKARFVGFSTHNARDFLPKALDSDLYRVVLFVYNHLEGKAIQPLVEQLHKKGVATVAMKVFAGGMQGSLKGMVSEKQSYPQAAIRWVLSDPNVDACIVTMSSYSHVDEYLGASGRPLLESDLKLISSYRNEAWDQYCRVSCRECLQACPQRVAINEVLRYAMYFEHYGMQREAARYYRELDESRKPAPCQACSGPCQSACPYGLQVRSRLIRANEMLVV